MDGPVQVGGHLGIGCHQFFYNSMVSVLRDGAPVPVSPESAIAALEIIEQAMAAAE